MKNWYIKILPSLLTLTGAALAPLTYWCVYGLKTCYGSWVDHIYEYFTQPLYFFSIPALLITAIVFFLPQAIFKSWLKFSAWVLPLAFLSIALTPVSSTRFGIDFFPYYRINAAYDAGVAFVVLSLLLIAWKYFSNYRTVKSLKP